MVKLYTIIIFLFLAAPFANAQKGDSCSNSIVANLCGNSFSRDTTSGSKYETGKWTVGNSTIHASYTNIYYTINLPTSSYQPLSLSASLAGYTPYCNYRCGGYIYFLWFNSSPCSSNPVAVDSFNYGGIATAYDSLFAFYNVTQVQQQYYLVIAFNSYVYYQYSLQFGFNNNQPYPPPVCSPAPPPYKGTLTLDRSGCYTSSNPYNLPLSYLFDNPYDIRMLYPSSLPQNKPYFPINDNNDEGFILSLQKTDANNFEIYTSFDSSPYTYSTGGYQVGITFFLKNAGGAEGIKGFRISMPTGYNTAPQTFPAYGAKGFYDTTGTWTETYDNGTSTYTWLFSGKNGRGDNVDTTGYSCKVYTFTGYFPCMFDTLYAAYLPDNYGNDSINCVPGISNPPRTDCSEQPSYYQTGWVQLTGNGGGGDGGTFSGSQCGYSTSCDAGVEFEAPGCTQYINTNYNCQFQNSNPMITYDSNACPITTTPNWAIETPVIEGYYTSDYPVGICNGRPYIFNLFNSCNEANTTPTFLIYDSRYPVDTLGNINYNLDVSQLPQGAPLDLSNLPTYACWDNYIPLSVPGNYSFLYTYGILDSQTYVYTYYPLLCGTTLTVVADNDFTVAISPSSDSTICLGNSLSVNLSTTGYEVYYSWNPWSSVNQGLGTVFPTVTTTYTIIGTDYYGCHDTLSYIVNVDSCPPKPEFIYARYDSCQNKCLVFEDESTNGPTQWYWRFPGGVPSSHTGGSPPEICYPTDSKYPVTLIVSNATGTDSITQYVEPGTCLTPAYFSVSDSIVCASGCVTYWNLSPHDGGTYTWSFPGGNPSTFSYTSQKWVDSIVVCYADTGIYNAQLIIAFSDTFSLPIHVITCPPHAAFTSADTICNTLCTTYTDASTGGIANWQWTFAGGSPSSFTGQSPPLICYDSTGNYTTRLVVTNSNGTDSVFKTITVKNCPAPIASFTTTGFICAGNCISVNDSSSNSVSWQWTFTGGNPSSYIGQVPPQVCYSAAGVYPIKLAVSNSYGSDSVTKTITVNDCSPPSVSFTSPDSICASDCITVTDSSVKATSWQWTFPGGTPSSWNGKNPPQVCYTDTGTYPIQLIVGNNYGTDSTTGIITITNCSPVALFSINNTVLCKNECTGFINLSSSNSTSWQWSFSGGEPSFYNGFTPPSVCYDSAGLFNVSLAVTNNYGSDTLLLRGKIKVIALPAPQIMQREDTLFCTIAASAYQWYYGSQLIQGAEDSFCIAMQNGEYFVKVSTGPGCAGIDSAEYISTAVSNLIFSNGIIISPNPNDGKFQVSCLKFQVSGIVVYNILGEIVESMALEARGTGPYSINLSANPAGVYFVKVYTENGMVVKKVVKQQ